MLIQLHGIIARKFEKELEIPSEIDESFLFEVLNTKFNGFKLFVQRQAQEGIFYKTIKVDGDYHIVPVIYGNIGAAVGFLFKVAGSFLGNFVSSMALGGIMNMISPVEDDSVGTSAAVVLQSTRFSGLENKTQQGSKVPVGYGRLRIGSKLIMQHNKPINWSESRNVEVENTSYSNQTDIEYFNPTVNTLNEMNSSSSSSSTY